MKHIATEWKADNTWDHFSYLGGHWGKITCIRKEGVEEKKLFLHILVETLICVGLTGLVVKIMWRQGSVQRRKKNQSKVKEKKHITVLILTKRRVKTLNHVRKTRWNLFITLFCQGLFFRHTKPHIDTFLHSSLWAQAHFFTFFTESRN